MRRSKVADRHLNILPRPLVDRRHHARQSRFTERRFDIDIIFLLRNKWKQCSAVLIEVFTNQFFRSTDQRHRDRHHSVVSRLAGNIFDAIADDIGIGHLIKVAHPAADHALENKNISLRFQLLVIPHIRFGQLFAFVGRNIDRRTVDNLRDLVLLERIIGGMSIIIEPYIERPQTNQHVRNIIHTPLFRATGNYSFSRSIEVGAALHRQILPHLRPGIRHLVVQLRMFVENLRFFHQKCPEIIKCRRRYGVYVQHEPSVRQFTIQLIPLQRPHQDIEMLDTRFGQFMRSEVFIRQREKAYFLFLNGSRRLWPQSAPDQLFEPLARNGRFIVCRLDRGLNYIDQFFQFRPLCQQRIALLPRYVRNIDIVFLSPTFPIDPNAGRHTYTQFAGNIDTEINLRFSRAVLPLRQNICNFCHTSSFYALQRYDLDSNTAILSCPHRVRIFAKQLKTDKTHFIACNFNILYFNIL